MTRELQKKFILEVATKHNLTSTVIEALFLLVDENKHWRCKGYNALELAFNRLKTYTEQEQLMFIEKAIVGQYRGLVWEKKPMQTIFSNDISKSKTFQINQAFEK